METYFAGVVSMQDLAVVFFFENKFNDFPDVFESLVEGLTLCVATFEKRAFHNIETILIFLYKQG
jgi:hypothetical protein